MSNIVLLFLTVPVVTALIGWITNWAAVKMIFYPSRFVGVGPIGWQGILYKQSHKFATGVADMATDNLLTSTELMKRIDPAELEDELGDALDEQAEALCKQVADIVQPGAWDGLPGHVKAMAVAQVRAETRAMSRELFAKFQDQAEDLIDLHKLVYTQLSGDNTDRLAEFTKRIGHKEFKFIEYYGGVFGFLIGLVQITVWSIMEIWWLMPIAGAIVGLVTNWLAIQMIFRPQEPTKYFGLVTYQGLFAKRQAEIARDYGRVSGDELLTPRNLIEFVAQGKGAGRIAMVIMETINNRVDEKLQQVKPMIPVDITDAMVARIKAAIATHAMQSAPALQPRVERYLAARLDIHQTVENKLAGLSKSKFETVLRGIFEEDEITLILVGGFLGGLVGIAQGMLVLAI